MDMRALLRVHGIVSAFEGLGSGQVASGAPYDLSAVTLSIDDSRNDERRGMARKHFEKFEAISSAVPAEDAFEAVIAIKRRDSDEDVQVFKVADGRRYDLASEADAIAEAALTKVIEVSDEGQLIWEEHAI